MRDPELYAHHQRNNPLADEQRREHPYDFVSLPEEAAQGHAVGHDRFVPGRLTGRLTLVYETVTPLHVGSGVLESAEQCGLVGGATPVRGITRRLGKPVLPGSSWKGAVRARFEAVTRSRLGSEHRTQRIDKRKLPRVLQPDRAGGKVEVAVLDPRVTTVLHPNPKARHETFSLDKLSPAEALFGTLGYRGRIHPSEGIIEGPSSREPLPVPPLESPAPHRLAIPGESRIEENRVVIAKVEGRKFYYDGELVSSRKSEGGRPTQELIDTVPSRCTISIEVIVESVTESELGALLVSAGYGEKVGIVRLGGFKPAGLGKVKLTNVTGEIRRDYKTDRWTRPAAELIDPRQLFERAMAEGFLDIAALAELHEITTRERP